MPCLSRFSDPFVEETSEAGPSIESKTEIDEALRQIKEAQKEVRFATNIAIVGFVLALFSLPEVFGLAPKAYQTALTILGPHVTSIVICTLACVMGFAAYWFKKSSQLWYGLVEMVFGAVSSLAIAFGLKPGTSSLAQWSSLVGASYVIARGLNNYSDAKVARSEGSP